MVELHNGICYSSKDNSCVIIFNSVEDFEAYTVEVNRQDIFETCKEDIENDLIWNKTKLLVIDDVKNPKSDYEIYNEPTPLDVDIHLGTLE